MGISIKESDHQPSPPAPLPLTGEEGQPQPYPRRVEGRTVFALMGSGCFAPAQGAHITSLHPLPPPLPESGRGGGTKGEKRGLGGGNRMGIGDTPKTPCPPCRECQVHKTVRAPPRRGAGLGEGELLFQRNTEAPIVRGLALLDTTFYTCARLRRRCQTRINRINTINGIRRREKTAT